MNAEWQSLWEIQKLKARYFRCMDTKDWQGLRGVFIENAVLVSRGITYEGREAILAYIESRLPASVISVHHGHMPEIELLGDGRATGIWAMQDQIRHADGKGFVGFGHYHERYAEVGGKWLIERSELARLRFDPLPAGLPGNQIMPPELPKQ